MICDFKITIIIVIYCLIQPFPDFLNLPGLTRFFYQFPENKFDFVFLMV